MRKLFTNEKTLEKKNTTKSKITKTNNQRWAFPQYRLKVRQPVTDGLLFCWQLANNSKLKKKWGTKYWQRWVFFCQCNRQVPTDLALTFVTGFFVVVFVLLFLSFFFLINFCLFVVFDSFVVSFFCICLCWLLCVCLFLWFLICSCFVCGIVLLFFCFQLIFFRFFFGGGCDFWFAVLFLYFFYLWLWLPIIF